MLLFHRPEIQNWRKKKITINKCKQKLEGFTKGKIKKEITIFENQKKIIQ
jgi:hypothetical protein